MGATEVKATASGSSPVSSAAVRVTASWSSVTVCTVTSSHTVSNADQVGVSLSVPRIVCCPTSM